MSTIFRREARSRVPPLSQPPIAAQATTMNRSFRAMVIFTDFPAKPATPSGVPGAHGIAGSRPGESNLKENDDDGTKLRNLSTTGGDAQEIPAHRDVRRTYFSGIHCRRLFLFRAPAVSSVIIWWVSFYGSGAGTGMPPCLADGSFRCGRSVGCDDQAAARSRLANALRHVAGLPAFVDLRAAAIPLGRSGARRL